MPNSGSWSGWVLHLPIFTPVWCKSHKQLGLQPSNHHTINFLIDGNGQNKFQAPQGVVNGFCSLRAEQQEAFPLISEMRQPYMSYTPHPIRTLRSLQLCWKAGCCQAGKKTNQTKQPTTKQNQNPQTNKPPTLSRLSSVTRLDRLGQQTYGSTHSNVIHPKKPPCYYLISN